MQRFYADKRHTFQWPNGAIGYRPSISFDCLGPFAKVQNCPIAGTNERRTAYATGYADTVFSIPACTRVRGQYIGGYFTTNDEGVIFQPFNRYKALLDQLLARSVH